jgi:AraC-like DNA-binding protein
VSGVLFYRDSDLPYFELKICNVRDLCYKKHAHDEYSVGLVDQGESLFAFQGRSTAIYPQTLVLIPPEIVHACTPRKDVQWQYKMLFIEPSWVEGWIKSHGNNSADVPIVRDVSGGEAYLAVNQAMHSLMSKESPLEKEEHVFTLFEKAVMGMPGRDKRQLPKEKSRLEIIKEYVHAYFTEKITLDQLERVSGINKYVIIRLFKEEFAVPPHMYQTILRINYARKELRKCRSIAQVAVEAGFYDQSHFHKAFKSHVGLTPEKYQKVIC